MTKEEHNRLLGILYLVYGGLNVLSAVMMIFFFMFFGAMLGNSARGADREMQSFMMIFMGFFGFVWLALSIPSFVTGYGLLKKKSWTKIWSYIAGGLAGMSFPLGTALCVYTFWFWSSGGGKALYENPHGPWGAGRPGALHGAPEPANWAYQNRERDYTYVPPSAPPDWRGK